MDAVDAEDRSPASTFAFPDRDSDDDEIIVDRPSTSSLDPDRTTTSPTTADDDEEEDSDEEEEEELEEYEKLNGFDRKARAKNNKKNASLNEDSNAQRGREEGEEDEETAADDDDAGAEREYFPNSRKTKDEHERQTRLRLMIVRERDREFACDKRFKAKTIVRLNNEAVVALKRGDDINAIAKYAKVFRKAFENNLTHDLMHVCHSNRAVAYLNLGLFEEALWDANKSQSIANQRFYRTQNAGGQVINAFVKGYARKGFALMGLRMHRLAKVTFENGLEFSPQDEELKRGLEESIVAVLADLHNGKGFIKQQFQCLPAPEKKHQQERLTPLPYASPLHRVHPKNMLPTELLTPFQAENDYHLKDTYNYMTVHADIAIPKRHFKYLEDETRRSKYAQAIEIAINRLKSENKDVRALHVGCGAGLLTMHMLEKGAHHVTATERWLYQAMACKENLLNNGFCDDQVKVVYKRPTDLALLSDVPVYCNLLLNDVIDDGLLSSGLIPCARHCLQNLLLPDAIVLPASATVFAQAIEIKSKPVCGFDVSAMDLYRSHPTYTSGIEVDKNAFVELSKPMEIWHFDLLNPPEQSETKFVDLEFTREGCFNAVLFWFDLNLIDDVKISTRWPGHGNDDDTDENNVSSLTPALFYLEGEIKTHRNTVIPLKCAHNTVSMQFSVEDAEYMHMMKKDASFPKYQFSILADEKRAKAYDAAIKRQLQFLKKREGFTNVLDIGCGSGLLSMMAARAGADLVLACDMLPSLVQVTRRNVAANGLSAKVSVVCKDAALLERGIHGPHEGCNMIVVDLFDCGLTGEHVLYMLEEARRKVANVGSVVVPAAATVYCMGVEAYTTEIDGFDMSAQNKYRWNTTYEPVQMKDVKHRRLTKPKKVFEFFFDNSMKGKGKETVVKLETVTSGYLNAVLFWFDLHMDEHETITTAPKGIGKGGMIENEEEFLKDLEGSKTKKVMQESLRRVRETIAKNPRDASYFEKSSAVDENATTTTTTTTTTATTKDVTTDDSATQSNDVTTIAEVEHGDSDYESEEEEEENNHYWGQALQYLERSVQIKGGKKIAVLAKREADIIRFSLKEGVGSWVGKPPWKIEWGGGASVESPHFQRVHYCQLLVNDFLMRLRSKRFAPIEKDMRMILAHCGSLFLDPQSLADVYHRLVTLELLHGAPEFSPGASMEALSKPCFRFH